MGSVGVTAALEEDEGAHQRSHQGAHQGSHHEVQEWGGPHDMCFTVMAIARVFACKVRTRNATRTSYHPTRTCYPVSRYPYLPPSLSPSHPTCYPLTISAYTYLSYSPVSYTHLRAHETEADL
eukprot:1580792-Rhodomonas_salina.1